jgi:type I restriction enzyme M protein
MAIKKSDLYFSLWASCDELRDGMDASQCKDYVLFMLFIKYISDKYGDSDDFAPPVVIPPGTDFANMVALKGKPDIGDRINTLPALCGINTRCVDSVVRLPEQPVWQMQRHIVHRCHQTGGVSQRPH